MFIIRRRKDGMLYRNRAYAQRRKWCPAQQEDANWTISLQDCKPFATTAACRNFAFGWIGIRQPDGHYERDETAFDRLYEIVPVELKFTETGPTTRRG